MNKQNCVMLSDHFHITYNSNGIITNLIPDSQNPDMKQVQKSDYIKVFILDEMELFRKLHHIPKFIWKKYGSIIKPPATLDYQLIGFQFKFLWLTYIHSVKISTLLSVTV